MDRKTCMIMGGLLVACGCVAATVVAAGAIAYGVLNGTFGLSPEQIGVDFGDAPLDFQLSESADSSPGSGSEAQAADPQSAQGNQPEPISSPESAYSEEARRECGTFADVFPGLDLIMAWKSADELTCGFGAKGSQKYSALVGITEHENEAEAASTWATDWGPDSQYAAAIDKYAKAAPGEYTYVQDADRFFLASSAGQEQYFAVSAGRLYGNSIVEFRDLEARGSSTAEWDMVEQLAIALIDGH